MVGLMNGMFAYPNAATKFEPLPPMVKFPPMIILFINVAKPLESTIVRRFAPPAPGDCFTVKSFVAVFFPVRVHSPKEVQFIEDAEKPPDPLFICTSPDEPPGDPPVCKSTVLPLEPTFK